MPDDIQPYRNVPAPTQPGFYRYDDGSQQMIFLLDYSGNWHAIMNNGEMSVCNWAYIEQCLGVYKLVRIEADQYEPAPMDKVRGVLQEYRYGGFAPHHIIDDLGKIGIVFMAKKEVHHSVGQLDV